MNVRKALLKTLLLGGLLTASAGSMAQGYYEFIPYYENNPFLFCTLGVPWDCWAPVSSATGAFTVTDPYCFNAVSAAQFARVCPHAFTVSSVFPAPVQWSDVRSHHNNPPPVRRRGVRQVWWLPHRSIGSGQ